MLRPTLPCVAMLAAGCIDTLAPGDHGNLRYVGNVRGATPLALVPPISDRDGNAYVLFGDPALINESQLFVGHASGGWSSEGCTLVETGNDFGAHGFVGRAQSRAWYWVGEALVRADGRTGHCERLLELDPSSNARLAFRAIIPLVRETPSKTTTVAWIQSPTDARPFEVQIDLERDVYTNIEKFEPRDAQAVEILGVGANPDTLEGVVVARYVQGETVRHAAFFYDRDGNRIDSASLSGLDTIPAYGINGYLMGVADGLYAGVDAEGQLLVLDKSGGARRSVSGMTAVGVHRWEDQLFVVGHDDGRPKIARIDDDGDVQGTKTWDASLDADAELGSAVDVIDDRTLPSRDVTWKSPRTAMGPAMFVHPHSTQLYADGTTTWLIAGPSFSAGGEDRTAIAWAPVGIAYEE